MTVKLEKVDDKTAYENLLVKYAELENKITDIKANCDLAIEGRDIKIKELEQKLEQTEKDLADYQFNYPTIKELEKENAELKEKIEVLECDNYNANCNLNLITDQLTNAKDLIHQFLIQNPISDWLPKKAEQFLSDIKEIEK